MDERAGVPDEERGLYAKYLVLKVPEKLAIPITEWEEVTEPCFVMKFDDDPHARRALLVYALSVEDRYPKLARDIRHKLEESLGRPLYSGDELDAHLLDQRAQEEDRVRRAAQKELDQLKKEK